MTMTLLLTLFGFAPKIETAPIQVVMPTKTCKCCKQEWTTAQCTTEWAKREWEECATCEPCTAKFWEGLY